MRKLTKAKRGKAAANENAKEPSQDTSEVDTQGNGNPADSDDESLFEKKEAQNQSKKNNKRGRKSATAKNDHSEIKTETDDEAPLLPPSKKSKTTKGSDEEQSDNEEKPEEYEVEKVVDCRIQGGKKQFRIRWKGYEENRDTWELEGNLNCKDLIEAFLAENPDTHKETIKGKGKSVGKTKKKSTSSPQPKAKKQQTVEPVSEEDGEHVYEVEKVMEVHFKKNGQRDFLIRWKGFGSDDDTWEPESNLNCKELIEKFMQKVDKAKQLNVRELRVNPQATNRLVLSSAKGRRSHRNASKLRATYYEAE